MADFKLCPLDRLVRHECEEFYTLKEEVDCQRRFNTCIKNPGHANFIPVCDFKTEHLPLEFQKDRHVMRIIQNICNSTVRIHVSYTSPHRPDTYSESKQPYPYSDSRDNYLVDRYGTGCITSIRFFQPGLCPCKECKVSVHPAEGFAKVELTTARHVVYDELEAAEALFECFYDTPDREGIKFLYGYKEVKPDLIQDSWNTDKRRVYCVTHYRDLMKKLSSFLTDFPANYGSDWSWLRRGFTVSHPHGVHKHISFGHGRFQIDRIFRNLNCITKHEGFVKCRLSLSHHRSTNHSQISQCCESENDNVENENEIYLEDLTSPSMMELGIEYLLPDSVIICVPFYHQVPLPPFSGISTFDVGYHERYDNDDCWLEFPEGCEYIDSNGKQIHIPRPMEINAKLRHMTHSYDIPTCPGSSGAPVTFYSRDFHDRFKIFVHSGADDIVGNYGFPREL